MNTMATTNTSQHTTVTRGRRRLRNLAAGALTATIVAAGFAGPAHAGVVSEFWPADLHIVEPCPGTDRLAGELREYLDEIVDDYSLPPHLGAEMTRWLDHAVANQSESQLGELRRIVTDAASKGFLDEDRANYILDYVHELDKIIPCVPLTGRQVANVPVVTVVVEPARDEPVVKAPALVPRPR